jgi:deoxyribodipyrimidine photo-lyase
MTKEFQNGLFIFRRDLRIVDNNGLNLISKMCEKIYTIFIFTPEQVGNSNSYKSDNSVQFMIESLQNLSSEIQKKGGRLICFYGSNEKIIMSCIKQLDIQLVCFNLDYSPYARERDLNIIKLCEKLETHIIYDTDYYLNEPNDVLSGTNQPYQKFTPYYEKAIHKQVQKPVSYHTIHFANSNKHILNQISLQSAFNRFTRVNKDILVHGGRLEGLKILRQAIITQKKYSITRNTLSKNTSLLSAYLKFGCVSIREVYHAFRNNRAFIRELYWRDFYAQLLYHFPEVLGKALKPNYNKIRWSNSDRLFRAWCRGETGFPILDASMRQLNTIGWTHNRGRMIASNMLTKIFLIDWRKGEKYYAQHLTDYDPASNNGGWQWSASTGTDSQPYFRIFNPFLQSKEYDSDCLYIKTWIPELKDIPNEDIHRWNEKWNLYPSCHYPKPIVNYEEQKEKALKMYKEIY